MQPAGRGKWGISSRYSAEILSSLFSYPGLRLCIKRYFCGGWRNTCLRFLQKGKSTGKDCPFFLTERGKTRYNQVGLEIAARKKGLMPAECIEIPAFWENKSIGKGRKRACIAREKSQKISFGWAETTAGWPCLKTCFPFRMGFPIICLVYTSAFQRRRIG